MSQSSGYGPPPRGGKPWWVWALGGCGGCLIVLVLVVGGLSIFVRQRLKSINVGPITKASIEQSLGVPTYPNAQLEPTITEYTLKGLRLTMGSLFKGVGAYITQDSPEQVATFYKKKLTASGWNPTNTTTRAGAEQQQYQKGSEVFIVQEQQHNGRAGGGTMIMLMRGGRQLAQHAPTPTGQ